MQEDKGESGRSAGSGQKQSAGKPGQGHAEAPHRYQVRQVTAYQASWMEREKGEEGLFTFQLILDHGVEEYTLQVDSDDVEGLLKLLSKSKHTSFDIERKVLMFANIGTV